MTLRDKSDDSFLLLTSTGLSAVAFGQIVIAPNRLTTPIDVAQPKPQQVSVVASAATRDQLNRINAENRNIILIVGMKMGIMMWGVGLPVHANDYSEEAA